MTLRMISQASLVAFLFGALIGIVVPSSDTGRADCGYWQLESLPRWFSGKVRATALSNAHEISCYLNPFYLRGNLDGEGQFDLAVLVVEKSSGKRGILVVHRPSFTAHLLGAGTSIGNGGDDFRWLGFWRVAESAPGPNVFGDPVPDFRAELIYVAKPEAASAWIGWDGQRYVWYQGAD